MHCARRPPRNVLPYKCLHIVPHIKKQSAYNPLPYIFACQRQTFLNQVEKKKKRKNRKVYAEMEKKRESIFKKTRAYDLQRAESQTLSFPKAYGFKGFCCETRASFLPLFSCCCYKCIYSDCQKKKKKVPAQQQVCSSKSNNRVAAITLPEVTKITWRLDSVILVSASAYSSSHVHKLGVNY